MGMSKQFPLGGYLHQNKMSLGGYYFGSKHISPSISFYMAVLSRNEVYEGKKYFWDMLKVSSDLVDLNMLKLDFPYLEKKSISLFGKDSRLRRRSILKKK